ncbi:hypothetical protein [Luteipulveratus halotolerans]|uniref:DUF5666 domain-containing protein n=1 Tax=Luteipulveratus halotolerans TaxID=1631356 RepID=A0A0L6CN31_9MICO|nr:hypothetical protein [Luteipulveratus halotolerans]KNX39055.1 hypothetical protein VV01_21060 [Luteipulveratus halotolerans]
MRTTILAATAALTCSVVLSGCSDDGGATGTPTAASSTPAASSTSTPAPSSAGPSSEGPTSAEQVVVEGVIGFPGRTCVLFRADDGTAYALTGPAVTPDVRTRAKGGRGMQTSLDDPQPAAPVTQTRVRVTGRPAPGARSTCDADVLVTSRIEVLRNTA